MVPLLIDENVNHRILRGLRRRLPALDYLLVQETEVMQQDDPEVLDWAVAHNRVVMTHDVNTMTKYAYARLEAGQPLSGLVIIPKELAYWLLLKNLPCCLPVAIQKNFPTRLSTYRSAQNWRAR